MITDLKNIAPLVKNQFPDFYREEGDNFLQFISAYYEWMDEQGPIKKSRNLIETSDIDFVSEEYIDFFLSKYMNGIPKDVLSNKALLEKHILDVYRSKGSIEGLKLLFRLLYNLEIEVFVPQDDVLVLSDGKWSRKQYIEIEERDLNYTYDNKLIRGTTSGATAYVMSVAKINQQLNSSQILYLTDIVPGPSGDSFVPGEYVMYEGLDIRQATLIRGSVVGATVANSDESHAPGDILFTESTSGSGLQFEVKTIVDPEKARGYISFKLIDGGYGYAIDSPVTVVNKFNSLGTGAGFKVGSLANTSTFTYNTNLIDPEANTIIAPANTQFNANTAVTGGASIAGAGLGVTQINLTSNGSGYSSNATITFGSGGAAATGTSNSIGKISGGTITYRGSAYESAPAITFGAPANTSFNANSAVTGGATTGLTTDANSTIGVAILSSEFGTAAFSVGDQIRYRIAAGNTAIDGLASGSTYFVQHANTTNIALAETSGGARIQLTKGFTETGHALQGITAVGNTTIGITLDANSTIAVTNANTFQYGRSVKYTALQGNTAITGLANNTLYYVQHSNDTVIALSTTVGGSRITLTPATRSGVEANGHYLQANTQFSANLNVGTIDSVLGNCLADTTMLIGSVKSLKAITSGDRQYNGAVQPTIFEKRVWGYNIVDEDGNLWGNNAIVTGGLATGNGVIQEVALLSSGYTFNTQGEQLVFINQSNNEFTAALDMIVGGVATEEGEWLDNSGFLNADKYVTDSDYYQEFSYEIQVEKSLDKYIDIIKKLTHPVGNKMFGKPLIIDTNKFDQNILVEATTTYNARGVIISSGG